MSQTFKILILDDEPSITEIVGEFIELSCDAETKMLNCSATAIEDTSKSKYDLIITDHHMPEYSGIDFLTKLRHESSLNLKTPVFFLTAMSSEIESQIDTSFENVTVLNKVENLHLIGNLVNKLFLNL